VKRDVLSASLRYELVEGGPSSLEVGMSDPRLTNNFGAVLGALGARRCLGGLENGSMSVTEADDVIDRTEGPATTSRWRRGHRVHVDVLAVHELPLWT